MWFLADALYTVSHYPAGPPNVSVQSHKYLRTTWLCCLRTKLAALRSVYDTNPTLNDQVELSIDNPLSTSSMRSRLASVLSDPGNGMLRADVDIGMRPI